MKNNSIAMLYIKLLIQPLETIIKCPDFTTQYTLQEQQEFNQLLLEQYRNLEKLINESK